MPLKIRTWECPKCGTLHDRDINAAKNLRDYFLASGSDVLASGDEERDASETCFGGGFCQRRRKPTPLIETLTLGTSLTQLQ